MPSITGIFANIQSHITGFKNEDSGKNPNDEENLEEIVQPICRFVKKVCGLDFRDFIDNLQDPTTDPTELKDFLREILEAATQGGENLEDNDFDHQVRSSLQKLATKFAPKFPWFGALCGPIPFWVDRFHKIVNLSKDNNHCPGDRRRIEKDLKKFGTDFGTYCNLFWQEGVAIRSLCVNACKNRLTQNDMSSTNDTDILKSLCLPKSELYSVLNPEILEYATVMRLSLLPSFLELEKEKMALEEDRWDFVNETLLPGVRSKCRLFYVEWITKNRPK